MSAAAAYQADAKTLARGAAVNFLGNVGRLSRALALFLMARLFGADVLGAYALAWMFTDLIGRFVVFGQEPAVIYYLSRALSDDDRERGAEIVGSALALVMLTGLLALGFLFLVMEPIARLLLHEPRLLVAFGVFIFALPAMGVSSVLLAATRARKVMKYDVLTRSLVEPLTLLVGTVVAWYMGGGLRGLAFAQATALWASAAVSLLCYRTLFPLRPLVRALAYPTQLAGLMRYALPTTAKDACALAVSRTDLFLVGHFLGTASAGVYSIVLEVAALVRRVRFALEPILAPLVAEQHYHAERDRMRLTYGRATRWALVINLAYFGVAALAGGAILHLYGNAFSDGGHALAILVMGQVVNGALGLSEMVLMMIGRPALMLWNMISLLALSALLNYLFIPVWGLTGAALGTATATISMAWVQVFQVRLTTGVHPLHRSLAKPLIACIGALVIAYFLPFGAVSVEASQLLRAGTFVVLYFAFLTSLGLEPEERQLSRWIASKIGRLSPIHVGR